MSNKRQKTLSEEQLRIERARYDNLVQNQILSLDFNEKYHKKIESFIYITIIIGGIFTWCSSGEGSNIYSLMNSIIDFIKKYIPEINARIFVNLVILALIMIPIMALCISAKNITKKLAVESLLFYQKQNSIFKEFIKEKIEEKEHKKFNDMEELWAFIKNKNVYDISFTKIDFENYLGKRLEEYKVIFTSSFFDNFANLILLNECIENTLVLINSSTNSEFTLILSENYTLL